MVYLYLTATGETVTRNVPGPVCLTKSPESQRAAVCARALANMHDDALPRVEFRGSVARQVIGASGARAYVAGQRIAGHSSPLIRASN